MMDNGEIKDVRFRSASEKALLVVNNCTTLGYPRRSRDLRVPILRREISDREVGKMRDTGREDVVVRKEVVVRVWDAKREVKLLINPKPTGSARRHLSDCPRVAAEGPFEAEAL
ncbi:hypothetical protein PoB_000306300 [Plakobranchus ocellatus]|uniref:Uncharacterized protein n=1 Tax=Plakobranchus ocellatus TaxID=259542 RepID=A0AAV3Y2H7_9GAST|nr:hypothetical protein PoB_000306300 [Plakobranchus ocellatus]